MAPLWQPVPQMPSLTEQDETGEKPSENTMPSDAEYNLERFVVAQDSVYEQALGELRAGEKRSHWMWFIFPQVAGLGSSALAQRFAIRSREEAGAYLLHPVLGRRLRECTAAVNGLSGRTLAQIFGYPDDLKFRSSMTLFAACGGPADTSFQTALDKYCDGQPDLRTLELLR